MFAGLELKEIDRRSLWLNLTGKLASSCQFIPTYLLHLFIAFLRVSLVHWAPKRETLKILINDSRYLQT
jgi:hypothetical protein